MQPTPATIADIAHNAVWHCRNDYMHPRLRAYGFIELYERDGFSAFASALRTYIDANRSQYSSERMRKKEQAGYDALIASLEGAA
jgi:hypothetical protein